MNNRSKPDDAAPTRDAESPSQQWDPENPQTDAAHLYTLLKPLHNLPRGKNTWDPKFIKVWWFWPASAVFLLIMFYVYPYIWDFFLAMFEKVVELYIAT
jgi:hypothetical protein